MKYKNMKIMLTTKDSKCEIKTPEIKEESVVNADISSKSVTRRKTQRNHQ